LTLPSRASAMPADVSKQADAPVALFVSDLHLQASMPETVRAFLVFLSKHAVKAESLYLLGDIFEYWAGDDDISEPFHQSIIDAIRGVADDGVKVYWIAGNRDFLAASGFAQAAGTILLEEPHVVLIAGRKVVLVHGDAQCTDDAAYMAFRAQVRDRKWQESFLAMPLAERKRIIEGMRAGSREAQRGKSYEIMDVNADAITALFDSSGAEIMVHGHTHRPARHDYPHTGQGRIRYVLPDWDCDSSPKRGGWIAMHADGSIKRLTADGSEIS
jgi:UDP-2,3-diacylglucosamine hydrolase